MKEGLLIRKYVERLTFVSLSEECVQLDIWSYLYHGSPSSTQGRYHLLIFPMALVISKPLSPQSWVSLNSPASVHAHFATDGMAPRLTGKMLTIDQSLFDAHASMLAQRDPLPE